MANSLERLLDKMENFAVDFNRKCNQISDMLTQLQIREETHFQPQFAAGVDVKNQSFSCSYDLRTSKVESPHLQPSSPFLSLSVPPLSQNYLPPPIIPSIPKVFAHETDDVDETTTIMTGDKVLDEMSNSEIVLCDGGMIENEVANGIGVFSQDAGAFINSCSIPALWKQAVVTSFSQNKVAIIDEWKMLDKMSLREIGVAVEEGKTRCLGDGISLKMEVVDTTRPIRCLGDGISLKMEVVDTTRPIPKPPPISIFQTMNHHSPPKLPSNSNSLFNDKSLSAAADLVYQFIIDRFLHAKGINLVDEAGSRVRFHAQLIELKKEFRWITKKNVEAVRGQDFEDVVELRDGDSMATKVDIQHIVSLGTGIVSSRLDFVEATGFVSPKWVSQLRDAKDVMDAVKNLEGVRFPGLTLNLKGFEVVVTPASESFSQSNTNCDIEGSLACYCAVTFAAKNHSILACGYVSCLVGCPVEGYVFPLKFAYVSMELHTMGCLETSYVILLWKFNPMSDILEELHVSGFMEVPIDLIIDVAEKHGVDGLMLPKLIARVMEIYHRHHLLADHYIQSANEMKNYENDVTLVEDSDYSLLSSDSDLESCGLDMNETYLLVVAAIGEFPTQSYYQCAMNCHKEFAMTTCFDKKISATILIFDPGGYTYIDEGNDMCSEKVLLFVGYLAGVKWIFGKPNTDFGCIVQSYQFLGIEFFTSSFIVSLNGRIFENGGLGLKKNFSVTEFGSAMFVRPVIDVYLFLHYLGCTLRTLGILVVVHVWCTSCWVAGNQQAPTLFCGLLEINKIQSYFVEVEDFMHAKFTNFGPWGQGPQIGGSNVMYTPMAQGKKW